MTAVVAALVRARSVVEAATLSVPDLTPLLEPVATAHAAHLEVLEGAVADADVPTPPPARVPADRAGALDGGASLGAAAAARGAPRVRRRGQRRPGARAGQHGRVHRPARCSARRPRGRAGGVVTVLDALQATLADEHAALYTYGVLGARTSQATSPALFETLTSGYRRHRARRDQLQLMVRDAGGEPVAAEAAYDLDGVAAASAADRACRGGPRGRERRGAARAGRAVDGIRARVGAHRGDVVGGVAPPARRDRRDVAGSSRARPA